MTEEKLYSLLELVEGKVYTVAPDVSYRYKISDGLFYCDYEDNKGWVKYFGVVAVNEKYFKEIKQKKKITLYRLIVENEGYRASVWDSDLDFLKKWANGALIVKTETKEIEVDE